MNFFGIEIRQGIFNQLIAKKRLFKNKAILLYVRYISYIWVEHSVNITFTFNIPISLKNQFVFELSSNRIWQTNLSIFIQNICNQTQILTNNFLHIYCKEWTVMKYCKENSEIFLIYMTIVSTKRKRVNVVEIYSIPKWDKL